MRRPTDMLRFLAAGALLLTLGPLASGQTTTPAPATTSRPAASATSVTAVTGCHMHGTAQYCMAGTVEYEVMTSVAASRTQDLPAQYTGCHNHGNDLYCVNPNGDDVRVRAEGAAAATGSTRSTAASPSATASRGKVDCHFHAGVEHCVGEGESETGAAGGGAAKCDPVDRDYNVRLRIGTLFVVLVTSAIGVFGPILLSAYARNHVLKYIFLMLKQFGAGVIISTAFVHLYTHATLMFANPCLGRLKYESTTAAIVMAGLTLSFVLDYFGHRYMSRRQRQSQAVPTYANGHAALGGAAEKAAVGVQRNAGHVVPMAGEDAEAARERHARPTMFEVLLLEAGIIFHSLLLGLTSVVAGDSHYITLFIVVVFHQFFEGVALGSRIGDLPSKTSPTAAAAAPAPAAASTAASTGVDRSSSASSTISPPPPPAAAAAAGTATTSPALPGEKRLSLAAKLLLGLPYALVTPVGMAIGIGVLQRFNGNDRSTILAIGTLDALSAGILVWVGLVEMLAVDWLSPRGELAHAKARTVVPAGVALIVGMALMSLLGKWI